MKLICDDCIKEMKNVEKAKLLLTDIPYDVVNEKSYSEGIRKINKDKADVKTFEIQDFLNVIYEKADIFIIFCGQNQVSEIFNYFNLKQLNKKGTVRQLIWCKSNPSPLLGEYVYLSGVENMIYFRKRGIGKANFHCKKNYFIHPNGSSKYHPTEKSHKLLEELILDNTNENDLIIDCCMGSGSTGIVALQNNRDFIGIELDENYYNIAKERINNVLESKGE